jgi:hypothetical protein
MRLQAISLASALAVASFAASSAGAVTVANGSFEDVQIASQGSYNLADIPGWTHAGSVGDGLIWSDKFPVCCGGANSTKTGDGHQFVTMGGGFGPTGSSAWSQVLNGLSIGQTYVVSFKMAAEGEVPTQSLTVAMTTGSSTAAQDFTSPVAGPYFWQNWGSDSYSFLANATSATLQFSVTNEVYDVGLDAVSVSLAGGIPEPATWMMMLAGFSGLGAVLRSRRKAARVAAWSTLARQA